MSGGRRILSAVRIPFRHPATLPNWLKTFATALKDYQALNAENIFFLL